MSQDILIEKLNSIISEAIAHGGDSGGAYFSNEEALIREMKQFLRWYGLHENYGIMNENGLLRFYNKSHIVE